MKRVHHARGLLRWRDVADEGTFSNLLADGVMVLHFGFILFVGCGALLVLWRRWLMWLHLPCVLYGAAISFYGWTCPLTPLEQNLRYAAGQAGYSGSFIEHYLGRLIYPDNWHAFHLYLGAFVLLFNAGLYAWLLRRRATSNPYRN